MRTVAVALPLALVACSTIPDDGPGDVDRVIVANLDATGETPTPTTQFVRGVVAFAPLADTIVPFAFNDTGIPVSTLPQLPAMTPFVPRPTASMSMELLDIVPGGEGQEDQVATLASTGEFELEGTLSELVLYGSFEEPRGMALSLDEAPVEPGSLTVRLVNVTPGLQYAGFGPPAGAPVIAAFEEDTSVWVTLDADTPYPWFLDLNGDGRGDVPYTPWELPPTDGLGQPQIVDIFAVPSGQTLAPPSPPIPVPILVIVPLTGPDEAISSVPNFGG